MRNILLILFLLFIGCHIQAQELNCTIIVNADKVPGSNKQVFKTLENSLNEFVSQQRWTNKSYRPQERIQCNMTLTIMEQAGSSDFKGNIQIQSSRPVYHSSYLTPVLNFKDDNFSFNYTEYEPLQYNPNSFESNLVSIMAFYVYTILGMDADTFGLNGGSEYYAAAQNVMIQAQQSGYKGWNQNDGNGTRFVLIDNLLSPTYASFRNTLYMYHLKGLDLMYKDKKLAKEKIADGLLTLKEIYNTRPNAFLLRIFMDAKADEIVDIYSDGPRFDTNVLRDDLIKMSPLNASKWNTLK